MDLNSVFISQSEANKNTDISGKLTYTSILESIPENKSENQMPDWYKKYNTEWRWRFLRIIYQNIERYVVEISYMSNNKRLYFNRFGEWVERDVHSFYDQFVEKIYYVYSN